MKMYLCMKFPSAVISKKMAYLKFNFFTCSFQWVALKKYKCYLLYCQKLFIQNNLKPMVYWKIVLQLGI